MALIRTGWGRGGGHPKAFVGPAGGRDGALFTGDSQMEIDPAYRRHPALPTGATGPHLPTPRRPKACRAPHPPPPRRLAAG